jgi:hypothetical protein
MYVLGKSFRPSVMKHSILSRPFVSYEENEVLRIQSLVFSSFQVKIRSFQINGKLVKVGSRELQGRTTAKTVFTVVEISTTVK